MSKNSTFNSPAMQSFSLGVLLSAASLNTGCSEAAVSDPNWVEDIRPIIQANCIRCHSHPALDGAPSDFRLDRYDDTTLVDGRVIRGAATMAAYIAARAGEQGTMPPDFAISDGQRDTLKNWYENARGALPDKGAREGNTGATFELLSIPEQVDQDDFILEYEIADNNHDLVDGNLLIGGRLISAQLRSGRGSVQIAPASLPEGDLDIVAELDDGSEVVTRNVGSLRVRHAGGNTAPFAQFQTRLGDQLISDLQSPFELELALSDPDNGDSLTVDLVAVRGSEEIAVASDLAVSDGGLTYTWDTSAIPEGGNWRLRVIAKDGSGQSQTESGRFYISHQSTDLRFADVQGIFASACIACHPRQGIPGIPHDFTAWADSEVALGVNSLRGLIFRRVNLESTMPPPSSEKVAEEFSELSEADRQRLREYLLGGSPE